MVTRESAPDCAGRHGAHTPGPWYLNADTTKLGVAGEIVTAETTIASVNMWEQAINPGAPFANARLIAAAPELALAASAAERKLVELRSLLADNGISCACTDEIVLLQEALIKAGV